MFNKVQEIRNRIASALEETVARVRAAEAIFRSQADASKLAEPWLGIVTESLKLENRDDRLYLGMMLCHCANCGVTPDEEFNDRLLSEIDALELHTGICSDAIKLTELRRLYDTACYSRGLRGVIVAYRDAMSLAGITAAEQDIKLSELALDVFSRWRDACQFLLGRAGAKPMHALLHMRMSWDALLQFHRTGRASDSPDLSVEMPPDFKPEEEATPKLSETAIAHIKK